MVFYGKDTGCKLRKTTMSWGFCCCENAENRIIPLVSGQRDVSAVSEHLIRHNAAKMSPSGSAGMMPLETRPYIRLDHGNAAGDEQYGAAAYTRQACRDRNGCAEHKRQVVLGQLAAHGVADTCTGQRKRQRKRLLRCSI